MQSFKLEAENGCAYVQDEDGIDIVALNELSEYGPEHTPSALEFQYVVSLLHHALTDPTKAAKDLRRKALREAERFIGVADVAPDVA